MHSFGVVLHPLRYGDSQIIADVFTETSGTVSFIDRLPRSGRAKSKASIWQPLSLVDVVWEHRAKLNLQKPREISLWMPWQQLPFEPAKAAMGLFLGEFLYRTLRHEQENPPLFHYLVNALRWLDEAQQGYANFHIVLLLHLSRFLGFMPLTEDWHKGDFFDLQAATFVPKRPLHNHYLEPDEAALVPKFLRMDFRSMRPVGLNGERRNRILQLITEFYRLHVPDFPELRSLDVLAEVFAREP
jgi:DNA repair protein RecO (recombination protein O)